MPSEFAIRNRRSRPARRRPMAPRLIRSRPVEVPVAPSPPAPCASPMETAGIVVLVFACHDRGWEIELPSSKCTLNNADR